MNIEHIYYQIINKLNKEVGICFDSLVVFQVDLQKENYTRRNLNYFFRILNKKKDWLSEMLNQIEFLYGNLGSKQLARTHFVLNELIEKVIRDSETILAEKNLYLRIYSGGTIRLYSSEYAFVAIIKNLVNTAFESTELGGIIIDFRIVKKKDGIYLNIKISDSGNGIPIITTTTSFKYDRNSENRFGILERETLRIKLVKEYIGFLNGQFSCEGQLGKGCKYELSLPVGIMENFYVIKTV